MESGQVQSLKEIAKQEGVCSSYVSRMVSLTLLAPEIVAAILDDALPNHLTLLDLAADPPRVWDEQRGRLGRTSCQSGRELMGNVLPVKPECRVTVRCI